MVPCLITVLIVLSLSVSVEAGQGICASALFKKPLGCVEGGHVFPGDVLRGLAARHRGQCLGECAVEEGCQSINIIHEKTDVVSCELLTNAPTSYSEMLEQENGTHFVKTDQPVYQLNAVHGYTCNCESGYEGNNCDTEIDECASNPCQNYATCVDGLNGYTCTCGVCYTGTHCETVTAATWVAGPFTGAAGIYTSFSHSPYTTNGKITNMEIWIDADLVYGVRFMYGSVWAPLCGTMTGTSSTASVSDTNPIIGGVVRIGSTYDSLAFDLKDGQTLGQFGGYGSGPFQFTAEPGFYLRYISGGENGPFCNSLTFHFICEGA